ncbi:MAG: RraA family protein [Gammaproteobacteria bacterium]|jgi:RraA family protein|nr:RraA family protein [Gammaproteobacteria bacterium]
MDREEMFERLRRVDPAALADANKQLRVVSPEIRPLRSGLQLLGPAYTVRCEEDYLAVIAALEDAQPGDVLVIDTRGSRAAVVGELFSLEAARSRLGGIVIDGACRDISTITTLDLPVYARSVTPVSGAAKALGERQIKVVCGGVDVYPGDIVFGDDDGIVVVSPGELPELLMRAEEIKRIEEVVVEKLAEGTSLLSLLNYSQHRDRIEAGDRSTTLEFVF